MASRRFPLASALPLLRPPYARLAFKGQSQSKFGPHLTHCSTLFPTHTLTSSLCLCLCLCARRLRRRCLSRFSHASVCEHTESGGSCKTFNASHVSLAPIPRYQSYFIRSRQEKQTPSESFALSPFKRCMEFVSAMILQWIA